MVAQVYSEFAYQVDITQHFQASRIFRLAMGMEQATDKEIEHLSSCERCRKWFNAYRESEARDGQ